MTSDRVLQASVSHGVAPLVPAPPTDRHALSRAMRAQLRAAVPAAG